MASDMGSVSCDLQYSGALFGFLLAAPAVALAIVVGLPVGPWVRAFLAAYVAAQGLRAVREALRPQAITLTIGRKIEVLLDGRWRSGAVRDGSFVMPWLCIVRWRADGERHDRSLLLLPGMLPADALRRVRVILRFG